MIYIVLATDDNFVQHCSVVIASVLANNKDVSFFVFTEGLKTENERKLKDLAHSMGGELSVCIMDREVVSQFPMPSFMSSHISIATYYRLFVERVLPKTIDRVIYMDCDIVVRGSLQPLFEIEMAEKAIGAVFQCCEWAQSNNSYCRLGYSEEYGYFNAGLLLINLDYWRNNGVTDQLFGFIKNNYDRIHSHDQDVLNAVLHKYVTPLDYTWNCLPSFFEKERYTFPLFVDYSKTNNDPLVIHFVSKPKPWQRECKHPYKSEYYKYLNLTSYKGWRPKFVWKDFKEYTLVPKVMGFVLKMDVLRIRRLFKKKSL